MATSRDCAAMVNRGARALLVNSADGPHCSTLNGALKLTRVADFESLERWTRSEPHRLWWKNFLRDSGGTGFWHETYALRGGFEAIYDDLPQPIGMMKFAPLQPARGGAFSARQRLSREQLESSPAPTPETEL